MLKDEIRNVYRLNFDDLCLHSQFLVDAGLQVRGSASQQGNFVLRLTLFLFFRWLTQHRLVTSFRNLLHLATLLFP